MDKIPLDIDSELGQLEDECNERRSKIPFNYNHMDIFNALRKLEKAVKHLLRRREESYNKGHYTHKLFNALDDSAKKPLQRWYKQHRSLHDYIPDELNELDKYLKHISVIKEKDKDGKEKLVSVSTNYCYSTEGGRLPVVYPETVVALQDALS